MGVMLSNRQEQLLDFIVREYVKTAEPVGSAVVSRKAIFDASSATVRNEMQALEEAGLIYQPHTSAGRIPTDKGYRWFVNRLVNTGHYDVDPRAKRKIDEAISDAGDDPRGLSRNAAQALQELSESLVIANVERSNDFYKTGLSSLMEFPEFREFNRMFQLADFFDHFDNMFERMEREFFHENSAMENFNILIGRENPLRNIQDETVIVVRHRLPHGNIGTLTIIGPTRMDYRKNIGLARYASEALDKASE